MELFVFGINHRTAPVAIRERWAVSPDHSRRALLRFRETVAGSEHLILSTCNRTEFYSYLPRAESPLGTSGPAGTASDFAAQCERVAGFYRTGLASTSTNDLDGLPLTEHFYLHRQQDAVEHLFRVAGGLDSLIVGETEILGQLRSAFAVANEMDSTGPMFRRLFPEALKVGKRVRTVTRISEGCISLGQAAMRLAERNLDLSAARVLLIGSGKVATITARSFLERGIHSFTVINRTREHADSLLADLSQHVGDRHGESPVLEGSVRARDWSELRSALGEADLVIASTGADYPIIRGETIASVQASRKGRPLVLVDLAIPRDFHPEVAGIEGVHLYNIDDFNGVVSDNVASRLNHVSKAEELVQESVIAFFGRLSFVQIDPVIRRLVERFESIRLGELQASLERFPESQHAEIDELTRRLMKKLLHFPIERIKAIRDMEGLGSSHVGFLKKLFLHDGTENAPPGTCGGSPAASPEDTGDGRQDADEGGGGP